MESGYTDRRSRDVLGLLRKSFTQAASMTHPRRINVCKYYVFAIQFPYDLTFPSELSLESCQWFASRKTNLDQLTGLHIKDRPRNIRLPISALEIWRPIGGHGLNFMTVHLSPNDIRRRRISSIERLGTSVERRNQHVGSFQGCSCKKPTIVKRDVSESSFWFFRTCQHRHASLLPCDHVWQLQA